MRRLATSPDIDAGGHEVGLLFERANTGRAGWGSAFVMKFDVAHGGDKETHFEMLMF